MKLKIIFLLINLNNSNRKSSQLQLDLKDRVKIQNSYQLHFILKKVGKKLRTSVKMYLSNFLKEFKILVILLELLQKF